jgi:hypothetical protein
LLSEIFALLVSHLFGSKEKDEKLNKQITGKWIFLEKPGHYFFFKLPFSLARLHSRND